jgi:hypothetical protein
MPGFKQQRSTQNRRKLNRNNPALPPNIDVQLLTISSNNIIFDLLIEEIAIVGQGPLVATNSRLGDTDSFTLVGVRVYMSWASPVTVGDIITIPSFQQGIRTKLGGYVNAQSWLLNTTPYPPDPPTMLSWDVTADGSANSQLTVSGGSNTYAYTGVPQIHNTTKGITPVALTGTGSPFTIVWPNPTDPGDLISCAVLVTEFIDIISAGRLEETVKPALS